MQPVYISQFIGQGVCVQTNLQQRIEFTPFECFLSYINTYNVSIYKCCNLLINWYILKSSILFERWLLLEILFLFINISTCMSRKYVHKHYFFTSECLSSQLWPFLKITFTINKIILPSDQIDHKESSTHG